MSVLSRMTKVPLLAWVLAAIVLGIVLGLVLPDGVVRVFVTFNDIFGNFLGFVVPLIILGLVTAAIADLGRGAGKWLAITVALAYGSSVIVGLFTYGTGALVLPQILAGRLGGEGVEDPSEFLLSGYLNIAMPPVMDVMGALLLAFILGIVVAGRHGGVLHQGFAEFRDVIIALITKVIIPLLPVHILGIFMNLSHSGQAIDVISTFIRVMILALILHVVILLVQFSVAGAIAGRNPLKLLWGMAPAYATALGTSSSAATIPVTLESALKNGVARSVAGFVIPLCATIHLSGSTMKITIFAMATMIMYGMPIEAGTFIGFVFVLAIIMIAAPGVPGGAIMAAVATLEAMLGFDPTMVAMMIATYIAIDSVGTATNVTGDGAIAVIVDKMARGQIGPEQLEGQSGFDAEEEAGASAGEGRHVARETGTTSSVTGQGAHAAGAGAEKSRHPGQ